jgi:hypothetical protein
MKINYNRKSIHIKLSGYCGINGMMGREWDNVRDV